MDRNTFLASFIAFALITLFLSCSSLFAHGQSEIAFTPTNRFDIPVNNSSISFAVNGTYEQAYLENGFWNFVNLRLASTQRIGTINLNVSAQNSNIKIINCQVYNSTFADSRVVNARLRYAADGYGKQIFNLGLSSDKGDWAVIVNGEYIGKNRGWSLTPDGTLTVMNTDENVTLTYYGFPTSYIESENGSAQSFLNEHSVFVAAIILVAIILIIATTINLNNRKITE